MSKKIVFIGVDAQVDFIDGALPNKVAQENVADLNKSAKEARSRGADVYWTQDTHGPAEKYLNTLEGKYLPIPHCAIGTPGWNLHPAIEVAKKDRVVSKPTFGSLDLMEIMRGRTNEWEDYDLIILGGYCSNICGIANAILARTFFPNTRIIWLAYAGAAAPSEMDSAALYCMESCQIDIVLTYDDYVRILDEYKEE